MHRTRSRRSHGFLQAFRRWAPWIAHLALAAILNTAFDGPAWADEIGRHRALQVPLIAAERVSPPPSLDELAALLAPALERALAPTRREPPKPRHTHLPPPAAPQIAAFSPPAVTTAAASLLPATVAAAAPAPQIPPPPALPDLPREGSGAPVPLASTAAAAPVSEDGVPLLPGWNLISLPRQPDSVDPAAVFSSIAGSFTIVHSYDACDPADPWRTYNPAAAPGDNDLTAIDHRPGLWVRATAAATLAISGTEPAETAIHLCQGWNLIGYPLAQPRPVLAALSSIAGKFRRVYGWDPADPVDPWEVFDVAVPAWANDLEQMQPGRGYWLYATEDTTLVMSNAGLPPEVTITAPANAAAVTAPTDVVGTVKSDLLEQWTLAYRLKGETGAFTAFASGKTPVIRGVLGKLDPSLVLNGMYEIELTATDFQGQSVSTSIDVVVEGNLKVGNFTLSFTDLEVPVAGLPIQVVRTYDSRDKRVGDFGVGWTLSLSNVRLQEDGPVGESWQGTRSSGLIPTYCIRPTREHLVIVTLPDDRVLRFRPKLSPECQQIAPPQVVTFTYEPLEGTRASLAALDLSDEMLVVGSFPGSVQIWGLESIFIADPSRYRVTLEDGRVLEMGEQNGLVKITDLNGNALTIGRNGITHSSGKGIAFQRDALGRITQVTDPNGSPMAYAYDASGDLQRFTDRESNASRFTYDRNHGLLSFQNPRGIQPIRNEYDDQGRLTRQIDATGKAVTFTHDIGARREVILDRFGRPTTYEYDEKGNLVQQADPIQSVTSYEYDARGNLTAETNSLGQTIRYTYAGGEDPTSFKLPGGETSEFHYIKPGVADTVTDALGHVTHLSYDSRGNLVREENALGQVTTHTYDSRGNQASTADPLGCTTQREYDTSGNLIRLTDPLGRQTSFTYDANGNRLSVSTMRTLPDGTVEPLTTAFNYDKLNHLVRVTYPDGSVPSREYTSDGRVGAEIDALGRRTAYEHNARGELIRHVFPDGTEERTLYDANGRIAERIDRAGRTTRRTYDAVGNLTQVLFADGTSASSSFDAGGRPLSQTDERGNVSLLRYDQNGRQSLAVDPLGHSTSYTYDGNGNLASITDAASNVTRFEYDANNRRTRTLYPDGSSEQAVYDALGRVVAKIDALERRTEYAYDCLGRLTKVTDALGQRTSFVYDEVGNLIRQTDARGRSTRFEHDRRGRLIRRILPLGQSETISYDATGNLVSRRDFNGKTTSYIYDSLNQLIEKQLPGGRIISFSYIPEGRASVRDDRGTTTYEYDARSRLTRVVQPDGQAISYEYDRTGNLLTLVTRAGTTRYEYDAANRLSAAQEPNGGATTYEYGPLGNPIRVVHANGIVSETAYDSLGRVLDVVTRDAAGVTLERYAYTLDAAGRRLRAVEQNGREVAYTYDVLDRLLEERVQDPAAGAGTISYTYDQVGNRLTRTKNGGTTTYTYDDNDRLLSADGVTYRHDENGNMVAVVASDREVAYEYDAEDRLIRAMLRTGGAERVMEYAYDADGHRVAKVREGTDVTRFLIDSNAPLSRVLFETNGAGDVTSRYTYGHDLLSFEQNGSSHILLRDGQRSVRELRDSAGAASDRYVFDAFGVNTGSSGSTPNRFLYTGQELDAETGLYYLRARYYDPSLGRFLTPDPLHGVPTEPSSLHAYAYAFNDPVNHWDPSGLDGLSFGEVLVVASIIGIVAGIGSFAYGLWNYGQVPPWLRGIWIHEAIYKYYRPWGFRCNEAIGTLADPPPDYHRPDCRHHGPGPFTGEVYEIKPFLQLARGVAQVTRDIGLLQQHDPTIPWHPGPGPLLAPSPLPQSDLPQFPFIRIYLDLPVPGVIVYTPGPDFVESAKVGLAAAALFIIIYYLSIGIGRILIRRPIPIPMPEPESIPEPEELPWAA
jgi:RHS repeat-associated protein